MLDQYSVVVKVHLEYATRAALWLHLCRPWVFGQEADATGRGKTGGYLASPNEVLAMSNT